MRSSRSVEERSSPLRKFAPEVIDLAYGVAHAHHALVLADWRGEVAVVLPAAEYRRLRRAADPRLSPAGRRIVAAFAEEIEGMRSR